MNLTVLAIWAARLVWNWLQVTYFWFCFYVFIYKTDPKLMLLYFEASAVKPYGIISNVSLLVKIFKIIKSNLHLKTLTVGLHTATQSLLGQKQRLLINKKFFAGHKNPFSTLLYIQKHATTTIFLVQEHLFSLNLSHLCWRKLKSLMFLFSWTFI